MSMEAKEYLRASKDRAVGTIMGFLERQIFDSLPRDKQLAVRQAVIDALNVYHERMLDLVKSDTGVRNDEVFDLMRKLNAHLDKQEQQRRQATSS